MRFELDKALIDEILFNMENQDGEFIFDVLERKMFLLDENDMPDEHEFERGRFVSIPSWRPADGFRLMEKFTSQLKNPLVRQQLSVALNQKKGVFRAFKNVLEQYPETEKQFLHLKEQKMKDEIYNWYNSLREEWGLQPVGAEPEDDGSLVLEDFFFREGNKDDFEDVDTLHKLCIEEKKGDKLFQLFINDNILVFPGSLSVVAENASGEFSGFISAIKDPPTNIKICALEVMPEYRGMGLGKTLLSKLVDKCKKEGLSITIDMPAGAEFFARSLALQEFKPCMQRFVL